MEQGSSTTAKLCLTVMHAIRRILRLMAGNPCLCSYSTKPFSGSTTLPSNWQTQLHNHKARRMLRTHHPGLGNPCHGHGSTTLFYPQTNLPASSQIHHCNCMGQQAVAAESAALVVRSAELVQAMAAERSAGIHGDESGNTTPSCPLPTYFPHRQRN